MPARDEKILERSTYLTLIGLFLGLLAAFTSRKAGREEGRDLKPFDIALLGLSTFRGGRLVAYDRVAEPLRDAFTETKPDEYGTAENVVAQGSGVRKALGELLSCPTCAGTWIAAGLVYGLRIAPGPTRVLLGILSATGLAELLDSATEALTWSGKAERKQAAPQRR